MVFTSTFGEPAAPAEAVVTFFDALLVTA